MRNSTYIWAAVASLGVAVGVWVLRPKPAARGDGFETARRPAQAPIAANEAKVASGSEAGHEEARFTEWLEKPADGRRTDGYNRSFEAFLRANPRLALKALELEPDQDLRQNLLRSALDTSSFDHIALVMESLHKLIGSDHLGKVTDAGIAAAVRLDPVRAIDVWRSLKDNSAKSESLGELSRLWPKGQDISPLVDLARTLEFPEDRDYLRSGLAIRFGGYEPSKLREMLGRSDLPASFTAAAELAYGRVLGTSASIDSLVSGAVENVPLSPTVRQVALERAAEKRTSETAEAVLRGGSLDDLRQIGPAIVGNLHRISAAEAAAWAQKLPPGPVADELQQDLVTIWLQNDPRGASEYGLKAPTERQRDLAALVIQDDLRSRGDPEGASEWAARIKSPDLRQRLQIHTGP